MYYRRKILLALLSQFDGRLDKIGFQKLLFLVTRNQVKKSFHFVPYKYGCFSFQANADLNTLTKYNQTTSNGQFWELSDDSDYFAELSKIDQAAIRLVRSRYVDHSCKDLIKLIYRDYPYFAINSIIAKKNLSQYELDRIKGQRPIHKETVLFTIGYEGISLEEYLNKLIINDIRVLCDVRRNPISMKFGFSKNQLLKACHGVGIDYIHIPEVGIENSKRQELNTQADYDKLFSYYKKSVLSKENARQTDIFNLLESKKRIALTCFEANIHQCHRKHLAESLARWDGFNHEVKHI